MGGFKGGLAGWVCAFDFGVLEAADAVVVVVDCGLEDCLFFSLCFPRFSPQKQNSTRCKMRR